MDFVTAVKTCFGKYATFQGRASRSEYWFFTLFVFIAQIVAGIIDAALTIEAAVVTPVLFIVILLPSLALGIRRLHDGDRSGWWYLLLLVPLAGFIVLLIWFCQRGTVGPNRFGEDSLAPAPVADAAAA